MIICIPIKIVTIHDFECLTATFQICITRSDIKSICKKILKKHKYISIKISQNKLHLVGYNNKEKTHDIEEFITILSIGTKLYVFANDQNRLTIRDKQPVGTPMNLRYFLPGQNAHIYVTPEQLDIYISEDQYDINYVFFNWCLATMIILTY